jgi:hypothetical protein
VEFTGYCRQILLLAVAVAAWAQLVMKFRPMGMVTAVLVYLICILQVELQLIPAVAVAVVGRLDQALRLLRQVLTVVLTVRNHQHPQLLRQIEVEAAVVVVLVLQVVMAVQEG